jgi:hypothetical protein
MPSANNRKKMLRSPSALSSLLSLKTQKEKGETVKVMNAFCMQEKKSQGKQRSTVIQAYCRDPCDSWRLFMDIAYESVLCLSGF